jgi:hypothetical protein
MPTGIYPHKQGLGFKKGNIPWNKGMSNSVCSVEECTEKYYCKGLCRRHYEQSPEVIAKRKAYHNRPEVKVRMKEYNQHPERKAYYKLYREKPETKIRAKTYQQVHKEKKKAYGRKYSQTHSEELKAYRRSPKIKIYHREYIKMLIKSNLQYSIANRLRHSLYYALQRFGNGKIQSSKKYGICWDEAIKKLIETKPADFTQRKYHIDHAIPLSAFDLTDTKQIQIAFSPENLQWLSAEENLSKYNNII